MNVKLTKEEKIKIANSTDIFGIMQKVLMRENYIDREKEHFWIIGLTANSKIIFIELVSLGSVKATTVEPMNVFRVAVLKGAVKVIFVHNHPSGDLNPSEEDKNVTDRLIQVGKILDIEVIDHLIITENSFMSFVGIGLMEELRQSIKYLPSYVLERKIRSEEKLLRKEAVKTASEKAALKSKKDIAKEMKKKGYSVDEIAEITGISEEEIKKIKV